jgi:hypothetical protein
VISPSQGRYLHTEQHKHRIRAHRYPCLEWIRTYYPSVRAGEDSSCLRPRGLCDVSSVLLPIHKSFTHSSLHVLNYLQILVNSSVRMFNHLRPLQDKSSPSLTFSVVSVRLLFHYVTPREVQSFTFEAVLYFWYTFSEIVLHYHYINAQTASSRPCDDVATDIRCVIIGSECTVLFPLVLDILYLNNMEQTWLK